MTAEEPKPFDFADSADLASFDLASFNCPAGYELVSIVWQDVSSVKAKCIQSMTGRAVLLKILKGKSEPEKRRFEREAKILASIEHENIQKVFAFGVSDNSELFIASELLNGKSLKELLEKTPVLDLRLFYQIFVPLASALARLHEKEILHRNLRPESIFISQQDDGSTLPKLTDFAMSKTIGDAGQITSGLTDLKGHEFFAPEVLSGNEPGFASDIFSLAQIMYLCLAGKMPFPAGTEKRFELGAKRLEIGAPKLEKLIHSMLEPEACKRPSAVELSCLLETLAEAKPTKFAGKKKVMLLCLGTALTVALVMGIAAKHLLQQSSVVDKAAPKSQWITKFDAWDRIRRARKLMSEVAGLEPAAENGQKLSDSFLKSQTMLDDLIKIEEQMKLSLEEQIKQAALEPVPLRAEQRKLLETKAILFAAYSCRASNLGIYLCWLPASQRPHYSQKKRKCLEKALEAASGENGTAPWAHIGEYDLGAWYLGDGEPAQAGPHYKQALMLYEKYKESGEYNPLGSFYAPGKGWQLDCIYRLGLIELDLDEPESGAAKLSKFLKYTKGGSVSADRVLGALYLAHFYQKKGNNAESEKIINELKLDMLDGREISGAADSLGCHDSVVHLLGIDKLRKKVKYQMASQVVCLALPVYAAAGRDSSKWKEISKLVMDRCRKEGLLDSAKNIEKELKLLAKSKKI